MHKKSANDTAAGVPREDEIRPPFSVCAATSYCYCADATMSLG